VHDTISKARITWKRGTGCVSKQSAVTKNARTAGRRKANANDRSRVRPGVEIRVEKGNLCLENYRVITPTTAGRTATR